MASVSEHKSVRVKEAVALYIASVLGGGILVLPSLVAATTGPASIVSWILVTLLSLPLTIMFGRLSAAYPDAGGMSAFVQRAFGKHPGDMAAWLYFFVLPIGQPAIALTGVYYFAYLFNLSRELVAALAYFILCFAVIMGLLGRRLNAKVQTVIVIAILAILVVVALFGLKDVNPQHFTPFFSHGYLAVGSGVALILWSYIGVENLSFISSDFENPRRDFLKSILIGTFVVAFLYIITSVVAIGVLRPDEWGAIKAPFALILDRSVGIGSAYVVVVISVFIALAGAIAIVWGGSNLCSSMALNKSLPHGLAKKTSRGIPRRSILFLWALYTVSIGCIYFYELDLDLLASIVGATVLITYILSALAYLKLIEKNRWSAAVTLAGSFVLLPFFGKALAYPVFIIAVYYVYRRFLQRTVRSDDLERQAIRP